MKYIWEIKKLERSLPSGVVKIIDWKCTCWENDDATGLSVRKRGQENIAHLDPENPNFIEYSSLTEDQVLGWISQEIKDFTEDKLKSRIEKMLTPAPPPTKATGLPW